MSSCLAGIWGPRTEEGLAPLTRGFLGLGGSPSSELGGSRSLERVRTRRVPWPAKEARSTPACFPLAGCGASRQTREAVGTCSRWPM